MSPEQKKNASKLGVAAKNLAKDLESGRFKLKFLGRREVFRQDGTPCCAVGHVISKAGLKSKMGKFKGPSFDNKKGTKWWSSLMAIQHLVGTEDRSSYDGCFRKDDYLDLAVIETETANDVATGEWRRREVVRTLRKLAACLAALA